MGCSSSTEFVANDKLGQDEYAVMFFEMISLSSTTINALYTLFLEIDVREVGHISYDDIIFKYRLENNEFYRRLFSTGLQKNKNKIMFSDYVAIFWNFLSLDEGLLSCVVYYLFDDDKSDSLDFLEIKKLIETIHQKSYDTSPAIRNMIDSINNQYAQVSKEQFKQICRKNYNIIAPIASIQFNLRKKIKGDLFWASICQARSDDFRMSNIEFVYQCMKESEAARDQKARDLRLATLSTDKTDGGKRIKRSSSGRKLERQSSKGSKILADDAGDVSGMNKMTRSASTRDMTTEDGVPGGKLKRSNSKKIRPTSAKVSATTEDSGDKIVKRQNSRKSSDGNKNGKKTRPNSAKPPAVHDDANASGGERMKRQPSAKRLSAKSSGQIPAPEDENGKLKLEPIRKKSKAKSKSKSKSSPAS